MVEGKDLTSLFRGTAMSWFEPQRNAALMRWQERGLPSRQSEEWMYTSVTSLAESSWVRSKSESASPEFVKAARLKTTAVAEMVFVNGQFVPALSKVSELNGLYVGSLTDVLKNKNEPVLSALKNAEKTFASETHLGKETAFASINSTLFSDAVVIHAAANTRSADPIILTFIHTSVEGSELPLALPRVFALFDRMSEVAVIENHIGEENAHYFSNGVTDGYLADGANVTYAKLQREGNQGSHIATTRFTLARDAKLESLQISFGAKLSRQDLKIVLGAAGAEAVVDGLYIQNGKQHVDNHTSIEHIVADTRSEQLYKGILDGESRAVFNGRVFIAQDAQRSNSSQLNNNLLLSKRAEVDTKPELEIFADDVKAGHGATIGRLDPEHLFYLRSRAISSADAVAMLAFGFANDLVLRRTNERVREALSAPVANAVKSFKVNL